MKIIVAPDKFKGSLPATQVAAAIAAGLHAGRPGAEIVTIPVADGGEGTVDAAVAAGFKRVPVTAAGPAGDPVRASYARRGEVAVAELAGVCGLAGFETALDGADLVITGEGSLDAQSLAGKTPVGVARAAARRGVGVIAVAGRSTLREPELAAAGIAAVYALSDLEPDLERCRAEAARLLRRIGQMIARDRLAEVVTGA
jgi:glycerate kinase